MNQANQENQVCPNISCRAYKQSGLGNVLTHDARKNRYRCRLCGKTWSGNYGNFNYGLRVEKPRISRAMEMLKYGMSIRIVAKFTKVSPSTVMRWKKKLIKNIF